MFSLASTLGRGRRFWLVLGAAAAAVLWGAVAAAPAASAQSRSFEPGYAMSKQYVAVTVYKILRDRAPDAVSGCERNVKDEPDRFDDLSDSKRRRAAAPRRA